MIINHNIRENHIAAVLPCYGVRDKILDVIARFGPEVDHIIVVDDCCPDKTAERVREQVKDPRCVIIQHEENQGVGGAVMTGYRKAIELRAEIVVKVDGDGQMPPELIPHLIQPITTGQADYTKGNRFHSVYDVRAMPAKRLFGNAVLSFMTKLSSGYWSIFDPTNGFTAIHVEALKRLELNNLSKRYFFESDVLINLGNIRAVVRDVPMRAIYADEESGLKISKIVGPFMVGHVRELIKRLLYNYFMRDFSMASVQLVFGILFLGFGLLFGVTKWVMGASGGEIATTGTVMLAVLPIILGFQMLLNFLSFDITNEPRNALQGIFNPGGHPIMFDREKLKKPALDSEANVGANGEGAEGDGTVPDEIRVEQD